MSLLPVGTILDDTYHVVRVVGEGGMGVVYEATHARLAGRYAIKVLLPNISRSPDALARFEREARVTSALQHPNVVQVIDHNTAPDGTEYLVMEYLAGESVAQRLLSVGALPLDAVVRIVDEIAAGLAAAHTLGVVHRDLKPDNVFLVPVEGREHELVKVLDFGISKVSWVKAADGELCGTPQYMAPEQVRGAAAELDGATDQFALAVIAYEMLTGRNPFLADTIEATFARVMREDPAPAGVSPDVDRVLARGFAKAKADRFASVTEFADALRLAASAAEDAAVPVAGELSSVDIHVDLAALGLRPRSGRWGAGLAAVAVIAACFSLPWVVRKAPHRFGWTHGAAAMAEGMIPSRSTQAGLTAPAAALPAPPAIVVKEIPHEIVVAEDDTPAMSQVAAQPPAQPPTPQSTQLGTADRPPRAARAKAGVHARRPRSILPPDEDATMPLDESFDGGAR